MTKNREAGVLLDGTASSEAAALTAHMQVRTKTKMLLPLPGTRHTHTHTNNKNGIHTQITVVDYKHV
jgi:hypothetical protein